MPILIVDDNPRMREMIRAILAPLDDTIHECADGADAVAASAIHQPDWTLMAGLWQGWLHATYAASICRPPKTEL